ncbi:nuclear transport factor 2 family protein [Marivirga sp. S37H4]|uniref:Nuclear transport factor 2 family protein n=1 Tax=Marivirga aurantiaca TaxID=2802615 RepID=A0A934X1A2_9BACT|nr:nuclear transport factor 2 family protein [Marivirga aurantiaca]MBK6267074.1 nuclear transport factor 2 family protein [Marivirga aurantiaca]
MNELEITTKEVLMHHLNAFGSNNLDEIMLDYTENSTLLTENGPLKGLGKIRGFFEEIFKLIPTGAEFQMKQLTVTENVAHIIWASKSDLAEIPMGSDSFFFENDKIKFHTVATFISNK